MRFLKKTERYFYGLLEAGEAAPDGVQVKQDTGSGGARVRFPCDQYTDWETCLHSVRAKSAQSRLRKTLRVHTKAVTISDEDWGVMQGNMVNPDQFKREDFRVYEAWLCHNIVDRDGERFSIDVLHAFEKSLPGKAVLTGHDWNGIGEGRFFRARLEKTDTAAMIKMTGPGTHNDISEQLKQIETRDNGLYWLVAGYYLLADDAEKIRKIDSGIISDMSIGFRAPALEPVKSESNDLLWWEYRNTGSAQAEALEGSHVFLGAQYGARTRKDAAKSPENKPDTIDKIGDKRIDEALKLACLCGEVAFDEEGVRDARKALSALSAQELEGKISAYQARLKEKVHAGGILTTVNVGHNNVEKTKIQPSASHFRAPAGIKLTTKQGGHV